jgi:hypothetical protein
VKVDVDFQFNEELKAKFKSEFENLNITSPEEMTRTFYQMVHMYAIKILKSQSDDNQASSDNDMINHLRALAIWRFEDEKLVHELWASLNLPEGATFDIAQHVKMLTDKGHKALDFSALSAQVARYVNWARSVEANDSYVPSVRLAVACWITNRIAEEVTTFRDKLIQDVNTL